MKALKQDFSFRETIKYFFAFSNFINKTGNNTGNAGNLKQKICNYLKINYRIIFQNRNMQSFRPLNKKAVDSTVLLVTYKKTNLNVMY